MSSASAPGLSAEPCSVPFPHVSLSFKCDPAGQTFIAGQRTTYPFTLTQPFCLDRAPRGMLTLMLQSISGGVYENERLALDFSVEDDACVHLTTQGATVVHSMREGRVATQQVSIRAGKGSFVEYLPDPLALFPQARFRSSVRITLEEGATVISGDAFGLHDPEALARPFDSIFSETVFQRPDGQHRCVDRFEMSGREFVASLPPVPPALSNARDVLGSIGPRYRGIGDNLTNGARLLFPTSMPVHRSCPTMRASGCACSPLTRSPCATRFTRSGARCGSV